MVQNPSKLSCDRAALLTNGRSPLGQVAGGWGVPVLVNRWRGISFSFGDIIFNGKIKNIPLDAGHWTVHCWFNTSAGFVTASAQEVADNLWQGLLYDSGVRDDGVNTTDISVLRYIPWGAGS